MSKLSWREKTRAEVNEIGSKVLQYRKWTRQTFILWGKNSSRQISTKNDQLKNARKIGKNHEQGFQGKGNSVANTHVLKKVFTFIFI